MSTVAFNNPTRHGLVAGHIKDNGKLIDVQYTPNSESDNIVQHMSLTPRQARDLALGILHLLASTDVANMSA